MLVLERMAFHHVGGWDLYTGFGKDGISPRGGWGLYTGFGKDDILAGARIPTMFHIFCFDRNI